jgi:thiamine biosynthesis lipoprotein ApbE
VTVQASNCTEADVLASTISILGPKDGFRFLADISHVKAIVVEEERGKVRRYIHGSFDFVK